MPPIDPYSGGSLGAGGPANRVFPIAKSDTAELAFVTTGVYVGGAGDVAVKDRVSGDTVVFVAVPAGTLLPIRVGRVMATGTSATNLVGLA